MKKNAMLKIAAVLLVAVLLTTCAISSTFAKYKSEGGSYTDSARVAKWGLTVTAIADGDAFSTSYGTVKSAKTVLSSDTTKVVAPGTQGVINVSFSVSGTPEVSCQVRVCDNAGMNPSTDYISVSDNKLDSVIFYDVTSSTGTETGLTRTQVNAKIAAWNTTYDPTDSDKNAAIDAGDDLVITWKWSFEDTDDLDNALADTDAKIFVNIFADVVQTGGAGAATPANP